MGQTHLHHQNNINEIGATEFEAIASVGVGPTMNVPYVVLGTPKAAAEERTGRRELFL